MARERDLKYLFGEADTQENLRGTKFAGYNALVEWADHVQRARSDHHGAHRVLTDGTVHRVEEKEFALLSN